MYVLIPYSIMLFYCRCKEEMYRHLSIEIGDDKEADLAWSIDQSMNQFFTPEVRELRCEKCESGTKV